MLLAAVYSITTSVIPESRAGANPPFVKESPLLVRGGHRIGAPECGLSEKQILTLEGLAAEPEEMLGATSISDQFDPSFFETNFWLMWCTTFSFQAWHSAVEFKRYLLRFAHIIAGFNRLHEIMRTVYEQYDSMVRSAG